ncbi:NAD(P)/FAD-dependent oxidoreductase [Streptomyces sp. NPDC002888]|uniref:NAD(P)/FAD-dependent oxidoreductase n=1 Tax=Streptomyces sp. NPDC002888 TaxID=3364668 RepID=UPI0036850335
MTGAATIEITGTGLAELACARLLLARGHRARVRLRAPEAAPRPLLLNAPTLELLRSLWGREPLADCHRLTYREVCWGPEGTGALRRLPQPAVVVDGGRLAQRLLDRLAARYPDALGDVTGAEAMAAEPAFGEAPAVRRWTVTAVGWSSGHRTAGRRHLLAGEAPLAAGQDERTARLVCTDLAWLHLTPLGGGRALLQAMVPGPVARPAELLARLLTQSALAPVLEHAPRTAVALPAAPRLHSSPAVPGRLLVGAGAIRYDPLSGTGTAQALRTAFLAADTLHAAAGGAPQRPLLTHYATRLRTAFHDHLATCARLYPQAFTSPAWRHEIDACGVAVTGNGV